MKYSLDFLVPRHAILEPARLGNDLFPLLDLQLDTACRTIIDPIGGEGLGFHGHLMNQAMDMVDHVGDDDWPSSHHCIVASPICTHVRCGHQSDGEQGQTNSREAAMSD